MRTSGRKLVLVLSVLVSAAGAYALYDTLSDLHLMQTGPERVWFVRQ